MSQLSQDLFRNWVKMLKAVQRLTLTHALMVLIVVGGFLRLYNLRDGLQFQGDQGRDALIVSRIFTERDLVFIGPVTSVGNMYLGPLYYYFMLPFLWLGYPSPVGPAVAVAVLSIITLWLMYRWGQKLVGKRAAFMAAFLMTFSHTIIGFARFSWNPNPAPLISLIMMYLTFLAWKKDARYWAGVALSFAILLQLHYLTLLAAGGAGLIWLVSWWENWQNRVHSLKFKRQLKYSLIGLVIIILSFTPLILFDSKHGWLNVTAFKKLIMHEDNFKLATTIDPWRNVWLTLQETHGQGMHILFEITVGQQRVLNTVLLLGVIIILGWLLSQRSRHRAGQVVIASYLLTGVLGASVYEHTIFNHYIAYLFPVTFWVLGLCLAVLSRKFIGKLIALSFVGYYLWFNFSHLPLADTGWTVDEMRQVSTTIAKRVEPGEKYNIVLLSESKDLYGQNYRYFLSTTGKPPLMPEEAQQAEKLFIINETSQEFNAESSPIREVQIFPHKNVIEQYVAAGGPTILVLGQQEK